jgi:hypothetical protein
MKKMFRSMAAVTAIALAMSLFLLGCGGSSGNKSKDMTQTAPAASSSAAMDAGGEVWYTSDSVAEAPEAEQTQTGDTTPVLPDARKIIRHASMDLETREFDAALRQIEELVSSAGGYIESSSQDGYSLEYQGDYRERYASIQARIPSEKLDEVISSVGSLCNVLNQSESMDDITDSYYDAQARLDSLEIQEERLLELLAQATSLEDMITLESALSDVRYQIESLTASLRRMDNQVTYSYLNISLQEVVEYRAIQEKPQNFGEQLSDAFGRGIDGMVKGLQNFALFVAEAGPSLLLLALVIFLIVLLVRACSKGARKRREAKGLPPKGNPYNSSFTTNPGSFQRYPQHPQHPQNAQPQTPPPAPGDPGKEENEPPKN